MFSILKVKWFQPCAVVTSHKKKKKKKSPTNVYSQLPIVWKDGLSLHVVLYEGKAHPCEEWASERIGLIVLAYFITVTTAETQRYKLLCLWSTRRGAYRDRHRKQENKELKKWVLSLINESTECLQRQTVQTTVLKLLQTPWPRQTRDLYTSEVRV